jgi:membrane protein
VSASARSKALVSFIYRLVRHLRNVGVARTAASLAFTTLLGLVPLFTVAFTYVARFSFFDHWLDALEAFLLKFLLPESSTAVRQYLSEFTAKAADLKGISTVFVVVTAVLLVAQVEREINAIWGIPAVRSPVRRVFVYALGFTAGPVLIGAAVYFTSWIIEQSVAAVPMASAALPFIVQPLALAIETLTLTLIYAWLPARSVRFRHALAGAVLAAIAFEAAKHGFAFYIIHVSTYQLVYGTLATLPLFLLWLYLSWIIVLVGAAMTATLAEGDIDSEPERR